MKKIIYTLALISAFAFTTEKHAGYQIGDTATDFSLKGTDGQMHSLESIEGAKGYVVVFTCNHCPYSKAYEDRLIALQTKYAEQGYPIVAINPNDPEVNEDDSYELMKVRAKEKGFNFLYLFDDGQKIYPQYGATKTPHVFLLDADRKVRYIGAIDDNSRNPKEVKETFLADAIEALKAGNEPSPTTTKAIGCSIKSKKG